MRDEYRRTLTLDSLADRGWLETWRETSAAVWARSTADVALSITVRPSPSSRDADVVTLPVSSSSRSSTLVIVASWEFVISPSARISRVPSGWMW